MTQLLTVAYHEAGHAVIAQKLGASLKRVSIKACDQYRGIVRYRGLKIVDDMDRGRLRAERVIMIALAGPAAQRRYRKSSWRTYHGSDDYRQVMKLAAYFFPWDAKTQKAFVRWLELRTEWLVDQHWPAIERLAHALMERTTMTGDEVKVAIWPPGVPMLELTPPTDQ
jgi:hypothetical protein